MTRAAAMAALAVAVATPLAAQTFRDLTVARHRTDQTALTAVVEFAAGSLLIRPATDHALYRLSMTYDADRFLPVSRWQENQGAVRLGVESLGRAGIHVKSQRGLAQQAVVELSPAVNLQLDATLGAAEGDLELGGLRIGELTLRTGASRTTVRFSQPNPGVCRSATVTADAAELTMEGLGNSGCRAMRITGGAGMVTLDFTGAMPDTMSLALQVALGGVTLKLPRGLGVRFVMDRFLASFSRNGFTRRDNAWVSEGFDQAARRLEIDLRTVVGGVVVEWLP